MTEKKLSAEQMMDKATEAANAGRLIESIEWRRKAMDFFPPLPRARMDEAFYLLEISSMALSDRRDGLEGEAQKEAHIALLKARARMSLHRVILQEEQRSILQEDLPKGVTSIFRDGAVTDAAADIDSALEELTAFGEGREKHPELLLNLGEALQLKGKFQNAATHFKMGMDRGADRVKGLYGRMRAYANICGDDPEAWAKAQECANELQKIAKKSVADYVWPLVRWVHSAGSTEGPPPANPYL